MFRVCGKDWKKYENDSDTTDEDIPDSTNSHTEMIPQSANVIPPVPKVSETSSTSATQTPRTENHVAPLTAIAGSTLMSTMELQASMPNRLCHLRNITMRNLGEIKEILNLSRPPRLPVEKHMNPLMVLSSSFPDVGRNTITREFRIPVPLPPFTRDLLLPDIPEHMRPPRLECPEPFRPIRMPHPELVQPRISNPEPGRPRMNNPHSRDTLINSDHGYCKVMNLEPAHTRINQDGVQGSDNLDGQEPMDFVADNREIARAQLENMEIGGSRMDILEIGPLETMETCSSRLSDLDVGSSRMNLDIGGSRLSTESGPCHLETGQLKLNGMETARANSAEAGPSGLNTTQARASRTHSTDCAQSRNNGLKSRNNSAQPGSSCMKSLDYRKITCVRYGVSKLNTNDPGPSRMSTRHPGQSRHNAQTSTVTNMEVGSSRLSAESRSSSVNTDSDIRVDTSDPGTFIEDVIPSSGLAGDSSRYRNDSQRSSLIVNPAAAQSRSERTGSRRQIVDAQDGTILVDINIECSPGPSRRESAFGPPRLDHSEPGPSHPIEVEDLTIRKTPPPSALIKRKSPKRTEKRAKLLKRPKLRTETDPLSYAFEEVIIVDEYDNNSSQDSDSFRRADNEQKSQTPKRHDTQKDIEHIIVDSPAQEKEVCNDKISENMEDKFQELNRTLLKILECPVCLDVMQPPIQNCKRGHLVCKICRVRLESCPYCRARLCETRNLAMEQVAESILYPCEYHTVGCHAQTLLRDKIEHENNCEHKIYGCFYDVCLWKGQYKEIMAHNEETHKNRMLYGSKHDLVIGFLDVLSMNWLIHVYDDLFHLNMAFKNNDFTMCVRHIGPIKEAARYYYTIDVTQDSAQQFKREMRYTRNVHTYNDKITTLQNQGESFYLRANTAKLFMYEGFLKCNIEIKQL